MRFFRRTRDTKTSVIRREGVSSVADAGPFVPVSLVPTSSPSSDAASTDTLRAVPVAAPVDPLEDSDVFLCSDPTSTAVAVRTAREVTLFVHGWHNVEPGLLSWTFPSLRAALDAVQRMKNAIGWCVVSGSGWSTLDAARESGAILVEQLA